jgi:hypothetical protein
MGSAFIFLMSNIGILTLIGLCKILKKYIRM